MDILASLEEDEIDDYRLAVHEAGHAVIALRLGWKVQEVSVLPAGGITERDGHCAFRSPGDGSRPLLLRKLAVIAASGFAAELAVFSTTTNQSRAEEPSSDREMIDHCAFLIEPYGPAREAWTQERRAEAAKLAHRNLARIRTVADALIRRDPVTRDLRPQVLETAELRRLCGVKRTRTLSGGAWGEAAWSGSSRR